eukprot:scaffold207451_cov32-Tisochrysis_lutea.AAC.1
MSSSEDCTARRYKSSTRSTSRDMAAPKSGMPVIRKQVANIICASEVEPGAWSPPVESAKKAKYTAVSAKYNSQREEQEEYNDRQLCQDGPLHLPQNAPHPLQLVVVRGFVLHLLLARDALCESAARPQKEEREACRDNGQADEAVEDGVPAGRAALLSKEPKADREAGLRCVVQRHSIVDGPADLDPLDHLARGLKCVEVHDGPGKNPQEHDDRDHKEGPEQHKLVAAHAV